MAERSTAKKRSDGPKVAPKTAPKDPGALGQDTGLAQENARLQAELLAAKARIAELEQKHEDVINRIAWVIDSLHNLDN